MTITAIREKLHDYIRGADDKKIKALYTLLDVQEGEKYKWWEDEEVVQDLESRVRHFDNGTDPGQSWEEVKRSINMHVTQ